MAFCMQNVSDIVKKKNPELLIEEASKEKQELAGYIEDQQDKYDLTPLLQKREKIASLNFKTTAELDEAKMQATLNNMKVINVVRYSAPILKYVCEKEKDNEKRSKLFVEINERLISYAKKIMTIWNISPEEQSNNWILNVLIRTFANGFTEDLLTEEQDIENLAKEIYSISEMTIETKYDQSYVQPLTTSVKLAIIKAATPIYKVVNQYPFLKSKNVIDSEIKNIMTFIVNRTTYAVDILSKDVSEEKDRVMLFKVILEESAKIFSDIWEKNGIMFNEKYKNASSQEMKVLKESKSPNGIDIFPYVCKNFNDQYESIVNLANVEL